MPFYEYQCSDCGHDVEALQKLSDPPLRECPACKRESLTRLMSAPAFRLKGAGWYETDFKSGDSKRNLADSTSSSEGGATASGVQIEEATSIRRGAWDGLDECQLAGTAGRCPGNRRGGRLALI